MESTDDTVAGSADAMSSDPVLTIAYSGLSTSFPDPVQDEFEAYVGDGEYLMRPVDGGQEPWLAESVEMVDISTWKITMRSGLKYQNGDPVTMEKVKSWLEHELVTSGEFGEVYAGATVTVSGENEITVVFPSPQAGFGMELSNYTLHFYDWEAVEAVGEDYNKLVGMGVLHGPVHDHGGVADEVGVRGEPELLAGDAGTREGGAARGRR